MAETAALQRAIVKIKVVGVGGGGNMVLLRMAENNDLGIELVAVNTDAKQLSRLGKAGVRTLQIGKEITKGQGTGAKPELGEEAAKNDEERIRSMLEGTDLVFITAGMGGGAGTGAAPVVAKIASEMGILTIGVVTLPFAFEGKRKLRLANEGIAKMQLCMDALIAVRNENLLKLPENSHMSLIEAFGEADKVLLQAIHCMAEMILTTGVVNVDFADVKSIFRQSKSSDAILGIGQSSKDAVSAVKAAVESPLIEKSLKGARGIILNISGSEGLSMYETNEAAKYINDNTHPDVNVILGVGQDAALGDTIKATIIATDFVNSVVTKVPQVTSPKAELKDFSLDLPPFMMPKQEKIPEFKKMADVPLPDFKSDFMKKKDKE